MGFLSFRCNTQRWLLYVYLSISQLTACGVVPFLEPPEILIQSIDVYVGPYSTAESVIGLTVCLYNSGQNDLNSLEVSFALFDPLDNPLPDGWNNLFSFKSDFSIPSGTARELIVPLDKYFWYLPKDDIAVENFCIRKISFDGCKDWIDIYGRYEYPLHNGMIRVPLP